MNFRHAAALALVGWYLIGPPVREPKNDRPYLDEHAAYSEWKILITFSDQVQCEYNREVHTQSVQDDWAEFGRTNIWAEQLLESDCIATDDPRLKEK